MKRLMRHPNGQNFFEADPVQRERLLKYGWTDAEPDILTDVVAFQNKPNEILETIEAARNMPVTEVPADDVKFECCADKPCDEPCIKEPETEQKSEHVEPTAPTKKQPVRRTPKKKK